MIRQLIANKSLHRELRYFFCIGLFTTFIDFLVYSFGHHFLPYSIAKTFSFITGSCFSYLLHKHFTFQQKHHKVKNMARFALLYVLSLILNVSINSGSIILLTHIMPMSWLSHGQILVCAFLIATGVSTVINFSGQKFWVFKNSARLTPVGFG